MGPVKQYLPPPDGHPESADPLFVAKHRKCGRCGRGFTTSAKRRYHCQLCAEYARGQSKDAPLITVSGGSKSGYGFGPRSFGLDE